MGSGDPPVVNASVSKGRSICKGLIAVSIAAGFTGVSMTSCGQAMIRKPSAVGLHGHYC